MFIILLVALHHLAKWADDEAASLCWYLTAGLLACWLFLLTTLQALMPWHFLAWYESPHLALLLGIARCWLDIAFSTLWIAILAVLCIRYARRRRHGIHEMRSAAS